MRGVNIGKEQLIVTLYRQWKNPSEKPGIIVKIP